MIHNIPKPDISPAFTIDDIHKIREWHYERLKDASNEERHADTERRAERTRRAIDERRKGMSRQEIIDDVNAGAREFEALIEAARQQSQSVTPDDIATHNRAMEEYRRGETIKQDAIKWA